WNFAEPTPFEALAYFEDSGDFLLRDAVALLRDGADIFVLNLGAAVIDLAHEHEDRLHDVERLEACDDDRLPEVSCKNFVGRGPDDRRDMRRANETFERKRLRIARLENLPHGGRRQLMIGDHREILQHLLLREADRRNRRRR